MNPSTVTARALVWALLSAGVRDVVLSPGSRSAPLVYAWADAQDALAGTASPVHLHVRIDERDAAFTALGIAKAGRLKGRHRPVAVVTTSGSAVGNLHPAVMEAAHAHLPLVLLTADRPARLRRTGANQTLDAQHLSLPEVLRSWDLPAPAHSPEAADLQIAARDWATAAEAALTLACASPPGPVQVNAQFDAPLVPDADAPARHDTPAEAAAPADVGSPATAGASSGAGIPAEVGFDTPAEAALLTSAGSPAAPGSPVRPGHSRAALRTQVTSVVADRSLRPVVVAGDDLGFSAATLRTLVEEHGVPVFAEPSSVLAASTRVVPAHAQVLGDGRAAPLLEAITHVVVTGRPTLSRPIARLLDRADVQRIDLPYDADGLDVPRGDSSLDPADAAPPPAQTHAGWWTQWRDLADSVLGEALGDSPRISASDAPVARTAGPATSALPSHAAASVQSGLDAAVTALLEEPGILVAASSNTVRLLARLQRPHHRARVIASRGLAGIDGLVATASGVALGLATSAGTTTESRPAEGPRPVDQSEEPGSGVGEPVRLLIGDLAALHDLGGLVIPFHEQRPHLQIVVLHDDGGAIFAGLEHSQAHVVDRFDRFFATPHGADLGAAAAALGWEAESADSTAPAQIERFRGFLAAGRPGLFQFRLPPVTA